MAEEKDVDARLKHDKALEDESKKLGQYEMHPLVTKIHSKFGFGNLVRNAANKRKVDIEGIDQ